MSIQVFNSDNVALQSYEVIITSHLLVVAGHEIRVGDVDSRLLLRSHAYERGFGNKAYTTSCTLPSQLQRFLDTEKCYINTVLNVTITKLAHWYKC